MNYIKFQLVQYRKNFGLTSYDISASLLTHNCSNSPNSSVESPSLFARLGSGCNPLCNAASSRKMLD